MSETINVSECDISFLKNEESIADWLKEKEEKGNQFIQRMADVVYEQFKNKE
ncbi:DNA-binding phage protein [Cytobacillus eiseniae]|uniref:DNA-binding phage protein n=2 Tax=Bacillaceae TaxID=186817 RepID=A0ABS4RIQ8_9BACI|nr:MULTISPECIES: hypothetical protein [Cytobacillus]MBP2242648.1 DNA-binding phage protein [Cytobacillus eiseniae]MEC1159015.1 hypothetical protein [Cytobacillus horneckiae]MED2937969.1 hypothetical protein [Cytobacillus horneckiae]